ncbi:MAG: ABC transporter permease [Steroidobacter sp.]
MKYFPLVWAGLSRKRVRSILTLLSIAIAFLLFGLLQGINAGFARAIAGAHLDFLMTDTRVRGGAPMPISAMGDIQSVPNVTQVAQRAYFLGFYREPKDVVGALATDPQRWVAVRPGFAVAPEHLEAMRTTRTGMLATPALQKYFGWKIGDKITLISHTLKRDGGADWTFDLVGGFDSTKDPGRLHLAIINYEYLDEMRVENRSTADRFFVRIADPRRSVETAAAIDRIFANSSHETRTRSDQERAQSQVKQMGDVAFFTNAIMGAVLFTLLFLTGNTMRQSVRERVAEFAVLKTIGYADARIYAIIVTEALLLCIVAAALGLAIAAAVAPFAKEAVGDVRVTWTVISSGIGVAVLLALLSVSAPAWRLHRLSIVDSLAGR